MSQETPSLLQPVDQTALTLAAHLLCNSSLGALAVLELASGYPLVSRVTVAADRDGYPVLLLSRLSNHTQALLADPRCSLLVGQ
jgi:heme iron utilization protein